jgi:hypothetical protein
LFLVLFPPAPKLAAATTGKELEDRRKPTDGRIPRILHEGGQRDIMTGVVARLNIHGCRATLTLNVTRAFGLDTYISSDGSILAVTRFATVTRIIKIFARS